MYFSLYFYTVSFCTLKGQKEERVHINLFPCDTHDQKYIFDFSWILS